MILHIPWKIKPGSKLFADVEYNTGYTKIDGICLTPNIKNESQTNINELLTYLYQFYVEGV